MIHPIFIEIVSGLIILPTLLLGSYYDFKERKFPKHLWNFTGKVGLGLTILMYLIMCARQEYLAILSMIIISSVLSLAFYIIGIRIGSGGDYRALIYIVWIVPSIAIMTTILSLVFGGVQVLISIKTKKSAPWALGIAIAFITSLIYMMGTIFM